jgi:uncharacterized protein YbbC (DUF1343 family)
MTYQYTPYRVWLQHFGLPALLSLFIFTACSAAQSKNSSSKNSSSITSTSQHSVPHSTPPNTTILPAAAQLEKYLPLLKNKKVGLFANHTSMVGEEHLVDVLRKNNVNVTVIFAPEHGFRGDADAGAKIANSTDPKTGIPVVSLYGKKRRPDQADLSNVEVMLFDIQDVGVRFYTYISSLEEYILSAMEFDKPLVVLDRPNPNGFYIDGPILEPAFKSFVGMQPIPVVYGMTIGEYANMILGEKWLDPSIYNKRGKNFTLKVIPCAGYTHSSLYTLPVAPSPNLPDMSAIYWYPSTCFFEGTVLSEGRGTDHPFQIFGHPSLPKNLYSFTPQKRPGAAQPKLLNQTCYGWNIHGTPKEVLQQINNRIQIKWLQEAYRLFPDQQNFFLKPQSKNEGAVLAGDYFFNKLAGNGSFMMQIKNGMSEEAIRKSWEPGLQTFKAIRKKYLLYP